MDSPGSGHSLRRAAAASLGPARGRGYPSGSQVRHFGGIDPKAWSDGKPGAHILTHRYEPASNAARRGWADAVMLTLCASLMLEAILPWVVLWLSDVFFFDTPDWSRWLVFSVPPALGVLALLLYRVLGAGGGQLFHTIAPLRHQC